MTEREISRAIECGVPLGAYGSKVAVSYLFLEPDGPYALETKLDENRAARSVAGSYPVFGWDEREMAQEWSIRFEGLADDRPFRAAGGAMPQAVVARGEGLMHLVVGPVHAGIIEPGRFTFSSGGETVVYLDAQLGYGHRGVERALEGLDPNEAAAKVARICGGCSAARSLAYALALERLAGFTPPQEVQLARLVFAELERIYNHLADLAASAAGAGWNPGLVAGMALKERMMRINAAATGHRLLFDAIVPGGIGERASFEIGSELREARRAVASYLGRLFDNASVLSRWKGAGTVSAETAHAFGAVGPAHRASHGTVDVRVYSPYGAYRWLPPRTARAHAGDVLARAQVKREEILESFRLIEEALPLLARREQFSRFAPAPQTGAGIGVVEGPRGAETVSVHVGGDGRLDRVHVVSASYRNWPVVARAMDSNIVPDFPLVNKSFNLCYACVDR